MTDWQSTACILCECNCGLQVQLGGDDGRRLVRFRGDKAHPSSRGYACEKPHRLDYYQNGRDRITTPLRRRDDGTFEPISWDVAIAEVAARLGNVRDTHGGESIFYYGGGGQGNHLPGTYASATRRALGIRYRSNALAQEKTGEFWVAHRMLGGYTRGDFEHCEVALFIGKNPWHSHSIPRARVTLREIAKDPARTLIVIDPRRTETAELADIHLQVKPGTDAWLLAGLVAAIVGDERLDHAFLEQYTEGLAPVLEAFRDIDVSACCRIAGVDEGLVREAARRIGEASSVASMEDLGVQMNRHSTLCSYLHRLVWLLTGNLGKRGAQYMPTPLVELATGGADDRTSPVAGARIIGGLVPCNVIAEEILTDHPQRYRAMIVEAANPAHSLADSKRFREAMLSLDTLVVIDVAMSETAKLAHYVLPATTQFEKAEATFFNFEFPANYFHVRKPLLAAPEGPLPEAEIHARLCEALGAVTDEDVAPLREAIAAGRSRFAELFVTKFAPDARKAAMAPILLFRALGPTLPAGQAEAAVLWGLALRAALTRAPSLARAGFVGPPVVAADRLFDAMLEQASGLVFAVDDWDEQLAKRRKKIQLALPDLLDEVATLREPPASDPAFPFVLSAGERRSLTANTIVRDPAWRNKAMQDALRMSPSDAAALGVASGDRVRLTTRRDSVIVVVDVSTSMQPGHVSLPNGLGVGYPDERGDAHVTGIAPNELTDANDRDRFAGTPWHKHVAARVEAV